MASGVRVPRKFDAPVQQTSLVRWSISDARCSRSSSPVPGSNRARRYSARRLSRGSTSLHIAYQGTPLELCSINVVTTLCTVAELGEQRVHAPRWIISVVVRYSAMLARPGAPRNWAIVS